MVLQARRVLRHAIHKEDVGCELASLHWLIRHDAEPRDAGCLAPLDAHAAEGLRPSAPEAE